MQQAAVMITSGIIDSRENDVTKAFRDNGFRVIERRTKDNWCAFVISKEEA